MARDKERSVNPATAALKSQKNASIKKQKAAVAAQRTERLASRNPDRLQRQYDDLNALKQSSGGKLKPKEQQLLQSLERDLRLIKKARQSDPKFGKNDERPRREHDDNDHTPTLGKRRRGSNDAHRGPRDRHSDSEDTDPEVRGIPMPRDTPPPIPRRSTRKPEEAQKQKVPAQHQKTYSAAPQLRDLRKEATDKFMPASVKARQRDKQSMLEPEEADALEEEQRRKLEAQEAAFRKELGNEALDDAAAVADFAEQQARHEIDADEASGDPSNVAARADAHLNKVEREEHADIYSDVVNAAQEAENEAVHKMIADGVSDSAGVERRLHQVEIEEIEDEDGPSSSFARPVLKATTKPTPPPQTDKEEEEEEDEFSWD